MVLIYYSVFIVMGNERQLVFQTTLLAETYSDTVL